MNHDTRVPLELELTEGKLTGTWWNLNVGNGQCTFAWSLYSTIPRPCYFSKERDLITSQPKHWEEAKRGHYQTKDYSQKPAWYPITNILPLNTKRKESNRCRKGDDWPHEKSNWQAEKKCEWFQGASPPNRLQVFLCVSTLNSHHINQGRNNLRTSGAASKYFLCVQTWCTPMTMLPMEQNVETMLQTTAGQVIPPRARKAMLADKTTVAWSEDKNLNLSKGKERTKRFESDHSTNNDLTSECQLTDEMLRLGGIRHSRRRRNVKCTKNVGTPRMKSIFPRGEWSMFLKRSMQASSKPCRCTKRLSTVRHHWVVISKAACVGYSRIS